MNQGGGAMLEEVLMSALKRTTHCFSKFLTAAILITSTIGADSNFAFAEEVGAAMGALSPKITLGTSGSWKASLLDGSFALSDLKDVGSIRRYVAPWQGKHSDMSVGVRLRVEGDGSAGLIFNVQSTEKPSWYALLLDAKGHTRVISRDASGISELDARDIQPGQHGDGELVRISSTGDALRLMVNDQQITHLSNADNKMTDALVGVIAIGPGSFHFSQYAFGPAVVLPDIEQPDDRVPATDSGDDHVPNPTPSSNSDPKPTPTPDNGIDPQKIDPLVLDLTGGIFSILFHEYGHFMDGELKLPVTGPEEDLADEFSAMVYVENMKANPHLIAPLALAGAKLFYYFAKDRQGDANGDGPWYDEHAPDIRRFGAYLCNLYGSFPKDFQEIIDKVGISKDRQTRCMQESPKRRDAWQTLLRSHRRKGDDAFPGDLPKETPGGKITVEWQPSQTEDGEKFRNMFQQTHAFENMADTISKLYVLPRDTKLVFRDCGVVNCFYNPDDGSVTMCYEMLSFVLKAFQKYEGKATPETQNNPTPAPQPPPDPTPQNFADELTDFGVPPQPYLQTEVGSATPISIPGATLVQTQDVAKYGSGAMLVDVLESPHSGTLPNAAWLPGAGSGGSFNDSAQHQLAGVLNQLTRGNRNALLVFFCQGAQCWESYNAALRAIHLGYQKVFWYRGGLASWAAAGGQFVQPQVTQWIQ